MLVVGGGPVGLAGALFLADIGMNVRVIEKSTQQPEYSKALGVNARTLALLKQTGATERLLKEGLKARIAKFFYGGKQVIANDLSETKL